MKHFMTYALCMFSWAVLLIVISSTKISAQSPYWPNDDPNWDWRAGDDPNSPYPSTQYRMYTKDANQQVVPTFVPAPWSQGNAWDGLNDNKKDDGWIILVRDFGTTTRAIWGPMINDLPYFALYNKYRGIMRLFILVKAQSHFTTGAIKVNWGGIEKTATLTHLAPRAWAPDRSDKLPTVATSLVQEINDSKWIWADYPLAYDPTIIANSDFVRPRMVFSVIGTTETDIVIDGTATGIGGTQEEVRKFMTESPNGPVTTTADQPATVDDNYTFENLKTKVTGTSTDWSSFKGTLDDFYKKLPILEHSTGSGLGDWLYSANNSLKYDIGVIKDGWLASSLPFIGAAAGLVDFLTGGGGKTAVKAPPTFYGYNISLKGTATTKYLLPNTPSIVIPACKIDGSTAPAFGSNVPLVYNSQVGIMNLTKTPILKYKTYYQSYPPAYGLPARVYWDILVKEDLQLQINPSAGLVVDNVIAWVDMDVSNNVDKSHANNDYDLDMIAGWTKITNPSIQLESTTDGSFVFRTIPVPMSSFKNSIIKGPDGIWVGPGNYQMGSSPDMTIKIQATFHRQDDPSAQAIVSIITYEPAFENCGTGNWTPFNCSLAQATSEISGGYYKINGVNVGPSYSGPLYDKDVIEAVPPPTASFASWSDGLSSNTRVVSGSVNVGAIYKTAHKSNNATAFSNNSQRKLVRTMDGWLHQVYESMGRVWLEHSTDNGGGWFLGNNGKPLDNGSGKCPSIDWHSNGNNHSVVVAYQQPYNNTYTIEFATFLNINGSYVYQYPAGAGYPNPGTLYIEPAGGDQYSTTNANPNIAWGSGGGQYAFALSFERKSTAGGMQPGIYWIYGFMYEGGLCPPPQQPGFTGPYHSSPTKINGTSSSSTNASIALNKQSPDYSVFDIVYQTDPSFNSNIADVQLACTANATNWRPSQGNCTNLSSGSGFLNYKPSMVQMPNNDIRVCWIRDMYGSGSGTPNYVNGVYLSSRNSTVFNYCGNMVNSISLNIKDNTSSTYYAYAQKTNNSTWQNFASNGTSTTDLHRTGQYIQLSNGPSSSAMCVSSFYTSSLPYYFANYSRGCPKVS
jgi:hypothetical protein